VANFAIWIRMYWTMLLPDQMIGKEICPNGELVQRYTKFCAPDDDNDDDDGANTNGIGTFDQCPPGVEECEMPFCDFGADRPFWSTVFSDPNTFHGDTTITTTTTLGETNMSLPPSPTPTTMLDDSTLTVLMHDTSPSSPPTLLTDTTRTVFNLPSSPKTTKKKRLKQRPKQVIPIIKRRAKQRMVQLHSPKRSPRIKRARTTKS
jgi:hypothetical protein